MTVSFATPVILTVARIEFPSTKDAITATWRSIGRLFMRRVCMTAQALSSGISRPLKHGLGYPKAVTVCIAVVNRESDEPKIVLCSDTRLDYDYLGSTNTA